MKKVYLKPEIQEMKIKSESAILTASFGDGDNSVLNPEEGDIDDF